MNLTLHQFRKEFRWLWLRWVLLLTMLVLDLAVNLEWVVPMRPVEDGSEGAWLVSYEILMRVLLWMVVWWFMLSVPPEESGNDGRGYALTRPLSRVSYWGARLMVWVVLVMLPLMVESVLYLWLSGRPFEEMMLGVAERAWAAGAMTLWVLPLPFLLHGWERHAVIVLVVVSMESWMYSLMRVLFGKLHWMYDPPQLTMEYGRTVQAAWLVGLLVPVVVAWHGRRPLGLLARVSVVMLLVMLELGVAASSLFRSAYEKPNEQEQIRKLAAGREVVIPKRDRHFGQGDEKPDGKYISFEANACLKGMPEEYMPCWRATSIVMTQNGQVLPTPAEPENRWMRLPLYAAGYLCHNYPMAGAFPGGKPEGLLTMGMNPAVTNMLLRLPQPMHLDEAVNAKMSLKAEWVRVQRMGEVPLQAGARHKGAHFEIELLKVMPHDNGRGERNEHCVTVVYRLSARSFEWQNDLLPLFPHACLLSPENRYLWQFTVRSAYEQMRGAGMGWCHMIQQQTFQQVLETGTGVTEANLAALRLVVLKPEYLGSSEHEMEMKDLKIDDYLVKGGGWPRTEPSTEPGNPRVAFLKQVRRLPRPAEGAASAEVARYVAAVCEASHVYDERWHRGNDGELKWPGDDREVWLLLAPFFVKHADLFRAALVHDYAGLTQGVMHEVVLQAGIPGVRRSEKTGMAMYEREVPVEGKPGQVRKRVMETLWLVNWRPDDLDVYMAAIRQRSDEPLWPLMDDKPRSTEEVLAGYAKDFDCGDLRWLMKQPDLKIRENAERLTREAYAQLPKVARLERGYERPLHAAVALGMPEALDWLLRAVAMREDDQALGAMMQHHAMFASLNQGRPKLKTLQQFVQDARSHGVKDYRYDAEKMIWELLPDRR